MKHFLISFIIFSLFISRSWGYTRFYYAEQWYGLFHRKLQERSSDYLSNIYYLEQCLRFPFGNPRFALTPITSSEEWKKYRYLFYTHVNLKLIEQYLLAGNKYDISSVKFYHAPFKKEMLKNLDRAESFYRIALIYWAEVLKWSEKASSFPFLNLEKIQYWQDEVYRISERKLDYKDIIERHLSKIQRSREELNQLNAKSY